MVKRGNNLTLYKYSLILTEFVFLSVRDELNLFKSTHVFKRDVIGLTETVRFIFPQSLLVCLHYTSDWLLTSACCARLLRPLILQIKTFVLAVHRHRTAALVAKLAPGLWGCVGSQFDFQLRSGCGDREDTNRQTNFHKSHFRDRILWHIHEIYNLTWRFTDPSPVHPVDRCVVFCGQTEEGKKKKKINCTLKLFLSLSRSKTIVNIYNKAQQ